MGPPTPPPLPLSLRNAVVQSLTNSEVVRLLGPGGVTVSSATIFDPQITAARARAAEAGFDPRIDLGYIGSQINDPPSSFFGPGIPTNTQRDEGDLVATLTKPWSTGATTSLAFDAPLNYLFFPDGTSGPFNPAYETGFALDVRQPLLRGAGFAVNLAPIRIANLRTDQQDWQVRQATMEQIRSVEEAYWQLQATVVARQSIEAIIPLAEETVRIQRNRFEGQLVTEADLARAETQLAEFGQRRSRVQLLQRTTELRLRNILGLPAQNLPGLIPIDPPTQRLIPLDVEQSVELAWNNRPDLIQKRLEVDIRGQELLVAENGLKPKLDAFARYKTGGLADRLDASLDQALTFGYTNWTLGTSYSMPLGNRAPRAARDEAQLKIARERALLQQMEHNTRYQIAENITAIQATWEQYELAQRKARESLKWVEISRTRFSYPPPAEAGGQDLLTILLVDYQQSLQAHVDAVTDAAKLLADYNSLHARLEEAQGTLLARRQVWLNGDDPDPQGFVPENLPSGHSLAFPPPTGSPLSQPVGNVMPTPGS